MLHPAKLGSLRPDPGATGPLVHPVYAAKQFVTADHAGEGRFGLNIVCGWNQGEFDMFGAEQREHDDEVLPRLQQLGLRE